MALRLLEQKLEQVEKKLMDYGQRLDNHDQILDSLSHGKSPTSDGDTPRSAQSPIKIEEASGHRGYVSYPNNAMFQQMPTFPNAGQTLDFTNLVAENISIPSYVEVIDGKASIPRPGMQKSLPTPLQTERSQAFYGSNQAPLQSPTTNTTPAYNTIVKDDNFPSYRLLRTLTNLYFDCVQTWCPFLHRKTTIDRLFNSPVLDEVDKILLHAIVATSLRFFEGQELTSEQRCHYHHISEQKVIFYCFKNSSIKALQALVILALDIVGDTNGPPGSKLLKMITNDVVQLGLVEDPSSLSKRLNDLAINTHQAKLLPTPVDFIEIESQRRLFWTVYVLDRYTTVATALDFAINGEIERRLPCRDGLWDEDVDVPTRWFQTHQQYEDPNYTTNLGEFAYHIDILGILSQVHQFLKKSVDITSMPDVQEFQRRYREIDFLLTSWKARLPQECGNTDRLLKLRAPESMSCGWIVIHATYYTTVIRLHSSAAYFPNTRRMFSPGHDASDKCLNAVESIHTLADYVERNELLKRLGSPFAFAVWVAARLLLVHACIKADMPSPRTRTFAETLGKMGKFWPVAKCYANIIAQVLDECRDMDLFNVDISDSSSSIRLLADMRFNAYDLSQLILLPRHLRDAAIRSTTGATPVQTPGPADLENFPIYGDLNYSSMPMSDIGLRDVNGFSITNFTMDPNSDWGYGA